jgi:hypothetical protein
MTVTTYRRDQWCDTCHVEGPHSPSVEDGVELTCRIRTYNPDVTVKTYRDGSLHSIRTYPEGYALAYAEFMRKAGFYVEVNDDT